MSNMERFKKEPYTRRFNVGPDFREDENDNWSTSTSESTSLRSIRANAMTSRSGKVANVETEITTTGMTMTKTQEINDDKLQTPFHGKSVATMTPATEEYNANGNTIHQPAVVDDSNFDTPRNEFQPRQIVISDSFDSVGFSPGMARNPRSSSQISGSDEVLRNSKSEFNGKLSRQASSSSANRDILNTSMSSAGSVRRSHDSTAGQLLKAQDVSMMSMTSSQELEYQVKITRYQQDIDDMLRIRDTMTEQMDIFRHEKSLLLKKIDRLEDENDRLQRQQEDSKVLEKMLRDKAEIQSWANVDGLNQELESLRTENERLKEQVDAVDQIAESLGKEIDKLAASKEQLTSEVIVLREEKTELVSSVERMQREHKAAQESWEKKIADAEDVNQSGTAKLLLNQERQSELEAELAQVRSDLQSQVASMAEKESQHQESIMKLEADLHDSLSQLETQRQSLAVQLNSFEAAKLLSLEQWQREREAFQEDAARSAEQNQSLRSELELLKSNLSASESTLSDQLSLLNGQALEQQQKIADLTLELEKTRNALSQSEKSLQKRHSEAQLVAAKSADELQTLTRQHELDFLELQHLRDWKSSTQNELEAHHEETVRHLREELRSAVAKASLTEEKHQSLILRIESLQSETQHLVRAHAITIAELEARHAEVVVQLNEQLRDAQTMHEQRSTELEQRVADLQLELNEAHSRTHSADQARHTKQLEMEKSLREELRQARSALLGLESEHQSVQAQHSREMQSKSDELIALSVSLGDLRAKLEASEMTSREAAATHEALALGALSLRSSFDHSVHTAVAASAAAAVNEEVADLQLKLNEVRKKYYQIKNDHHEEVKRLKNDHHRELSEQRISSRTETEGLRRDLEVLRSQLGAASRDHQGTFDELSELKSHLLSVEQEVVRARLETTSLSSENSHLKKRIGDLTEEVQLKSDKNKHVESLVESLKAQIDQGNATISELKSKAKKTKADIKAYLKSNNANLSSLKDLLVKNTSAAALVLNPSGNFGMSLMTSLPMIAEGPEVNQWEEVLPLAHRLVDHQKKLESELSETHRQLRDLQRSLKSKEEELQEWQRETESTYSTHSQAAAQWQSKVHSTQESNAAYQREIEDLLSKLEIEQKRRFEWEDRCVSLEAMKSELLSQQVVMMQESDGATLELRKLVDHKDSQLRSMETEVKTLTQELKIAQNEKAAINSKVVSEADKHQAELGRLRDELKQARDLSEQKAAEWLSERARLDRELTRVNRDLDQSKQEHLSQSARCSALARDILSTLQTMPLSNSSTNKSVTSTPYNSVEKGDLEVALQSIHSIATLKSLTLYELLEQHSKAGKLLKHEIEEYSKSFLHHMERLFDDENSSSTDSSTSGSGGGGDGGSPVMVSSAHINKYPQLSQPENRELNQTMIRLEKRVLDAVFQAENARSYLGVETKKVNSLQSQLSQAQTTIADLQRQLSAVQEYAATVSEEQQQQALQEGLEMKQELQKYSSTVAELQQSRKEQLHREEDMKKSVSELTAKLSALEVRYNADLAEKKELQAVSSDLTKQLSATAAELHQVKLSHAQSSQKAQLLDGEMQHLQKALMEVTAEKDSLLMKMSTLESGLSSSRLAQESLQQLKAQLEADVIKLRNENESLLMSNTSTQHEKRQFEFQSKQLHQQIAGLKTAISDRETEIKDLTSSLSKSQISEEQSKADLWLLTKDKQALTLQLEGLQAELENHKIALESAKLSTAAVETQLVAAREENAGYSQLFTEAQDEMVALKQSLSGMTQELLALKERQHELIELDNTRHLLVVSKQELSDARLLLKDVSKEKEELQNQLVSVLQSEKTVRAERDAANEHLNQVIRDSKGVQQDLDGVMRRNDDLNAKVDSLTSQLALHQSSHRDVERQLFDVTARQVELEQQLAVKTLELENLSDFHMKDKQAMIDEFSEEIREYEEALVRATQREKELDSEHSSVVHEVTSLRMELESVTTLRNETLVQVTEITELLHREQQQHDVLKQSHRSLSEKVDSLTMQLNNAEVFFSEYRASHADYTNQLVSVSNELKSALSANDRLNEEKDYLTKLLDSINNDYKTGQREIQQLQTQLHLLEQRLTATSDREKVYTQSQESFAEERSLWEKQLRKSDEEIKDLRTQLNESRIETRDKERSLGDMKNEITMIQSRVQALEKEKLSVQSELLLKVSEHQIAVTDLARLQSDLRMTQTELESVRREMYTQSDKATKLLTERDDSQRLCSEQKRQIGELQRELHTQTVQLARAEESRTQYASDMVKLEQQLSTVKNELSSSCNEIKALQQDVKHLETHNHSLAARESEHLSSIERLSEVNHELRDKLALSQSAVRECESQLKSLHATRGDSNRREAKLEERVEELLKENTNLSAARDSLQSRVKNLEYKLRDKQVTLQSAEKEVESLTAQLAEVESELNDERIKSLGLVQDLDESTLELSKFMSNVQTLQRRHEDQVEELESEIERLKAECEQWQERCLSTESEWKSRHQDMLEGESVKEREHRSALTRLQERDRQTASELQTLRTRIAECESALQHSSTSFTAEVARLNLQISSLTEEMALKNSELTSTREECERVSAQLKVAQAEGASAGQEQHSLTVELKQASERIADLEAVLGDLRGVNATLTSEVEELKRAQLRSEADLSDLMARQARETAEMESHIQALSSSLSTTTEQLTQELESKEHLTAQLNARKETIRELTAQVAAQSAALEEHAQANIELSSALETTRRAKESLESQHREKVTSLVEDLASANNLLSSVEGEIERTSQDHTGLESELVSVRGALSRLESSHVQVTEEFVRASQELESVRKSLAALQETQALEKTEYQTNVDSLNSVIVHYRTELQELQTSSAEAVNLLNNSLRFLLISLSQIQLEDKSLSQQLTSIINGGETITAGSLSDVASVVERIVALCNTLRIDLNQATALNQSLKTNIEELSSQLQSAESQRAAASTELTAVLTQSTSSTTVITSLQTELLLKTEQVTKYTQQIGLYESVLQQNDDIIAQLKSSNQSLQFHCETVVSELDLAKQRINSLEMSLHNSQTATALFQKQEQEMREQRDRIDQLQDQIRELKSSETRLANEVESSGSKMNSIQASKLELQSEIELLTIKNLKQQQEIESCKRDLLEAQRDHEVLVHDNKQLRSAFLLQESEKAQLTTLLESRNDALHDLTQELSHVYKRINQFHDAMLGIDTAAFSNSSNGNLPELHAVDPILVTATTQSKLQNVNDLFHSIRKRHGALLQEYQRLCATSVDKSVLREREAVLASQRADDARLVSDLQRLLRQTMGPSASDVPSDRQTLLAALGDRLVALTSELTQLHATHAQALDKLSVENTRKISELSMQLSTQAVRLEAMEGSVSQREHELQQELARVMTERTDLLALLEGLQSESQSREQELKTALRELDVMRGKDRDTEKELKYYQYTMTELNEAVRALETENETLRSDRDSLLEEKRRIQSSILEFDSHLSQQGDDPLLDSLGNSPNMKGVHNIQAGSKKNIAATSTATTTSTVRHSDFDLEGDITESFEKLLKERRRLKRLTNSQQLAILTLRVLLKQTEENKNNLSSVSEPQSPVGPIQIRK